MKEFKSYLKTQQSILEIKLQSIIRDIEKFPSPENIDITNFGTKEELHKSYLKDNKTNILKRIIGPSKTELQIYLRNREINKLTKEKTKCERQINQIKQALSVIKEKDIIGEIWPNDEIIRYILEYASTRNINPNEVLKFLVQLCKYSKQNDKVEDKIKTNIARFFDENEIILEETKNSTISLLFEKLFITILTEKEQDKYALVIKQILTELTVVKNEVTQKETKPELEQQRQALIELQDYINGNCIIKTLNTKSFHKLLELAGIPRATQLELITQMEQKIKEENEEQQRNLIVTTIKRFLTEEEIEVLRQAELKENTLIGPLKGLLSRAKKDVISMCKYLCYMDEVADMHESLEILSDRNRVLKRILESIEQEQKEPNTLYYVTDKEGVPLFLRNLELHESNDYNMIYNLLYRVSTKEKGKRLFTKDNIDFQYIGNRLHKIVYVEQSGIRIVIGIDSQIPSYSVKKNLTKDALDKIEEITHRSIHPTFKEIHATYESVILEALNIKETGYTLSLKKNNN